VYVHKWRYTFQRLVFRLGVNPIAPAALLIPFGT
jgi:hypothetical protein